MGTRVVEVVRWPVGAAIGVAVLFAGGVPLGIVVLGVVLGGLQALTAAGLVLVHRMTGVVNFAQAELGAVSGVLAIELVLRWRWPWLLAVAIAVVTSAALGAAVDVLIMRRFRRAPRLIAAVVTIGLAQVLAGAAQLLAGVIDGRGLLTTPFSGSVEIHPVVFDGDHLLAVLAVAGALLALHRFLSGTHYGVATRAAADNAERAGYLGVPVVRLSAITWAAAGAMSAIAVVLRAPVVGFSSIASVSGGGSGLLLRALAAAVIARMEHIPRAAVAAVGIAVLEQAAGWRWANPTFVDALLVAVILVALLLQRGGTRQSALAGWQAIREVRPIPAELRGLPEVQWARRGGLTLVAVFAVTLPLWARSSQELAAALVLVYAIVAVSLVVLTGWSGHVSLGQFALVGLSGTVTAVLYQRHGWDFFAALPAGVAVAAVVAVLIGLPALRLPGPFLAVTTLALAVTAATYVLESRYFPWLVQEDLERPVLWGRLSLEQDWQVYLMCLAAFAATAAVVHNLRRTRTGRLAIAVRDNPAAAEMAAVPPARVQLGVFALSGAIAGLAGALYVVHQHGLNEAAFTPDAGLRIFSMAVIGGLGSIPGAVLGAAYVRGVELWLPAEWALLTSGAGVVAVLMFLPDGLSGGLYRLRDALLRRVAKRHGLMAPRAAPNGSVDAEAA
jgi:branched-chain amino acid transport system permease protein